MADLKEMILTEIAREYQVPVDMLTGRRITLTVSKKDIRKFYARHNAMLKGIRRRNRRTKALVVKMIRKGKM